MKVEGPEDAIKNWKARIEGIDSSIEEIDSIISSFSKPENELLKEKIVALEVGLADILAVYKGDRLNARRGKIIFCKYNNFIDFKENN